MARLWVLVHVEDDENPLRQHVYIVADKEHDSDIISQTVSWTCTLIQWL